MDSENSNRILSNEEKEQAEWDDYFMSICCLAAERSKDPCSQVGACIVNKQNVVLGVGYNGMPMGCSDDEFPWSKDSKNELENKYMYVCHAEMNAFVNTYSVDKKGSVIYVNLFPCNECSKMIIQFGLSEVVYLSDKHSHKLSTKASKHMLEKAGIQVRQFIPNRRHVVIDFMAIDKSSMCQAPAIEQNEEVDQLVIKTAQCQV